MAIIKYGPLASEVRGSIGGTVFSRSRSGTYVRAKQKPVYNPTNARGKWQQALSFISWLWRDAFMDALRPAWNTLGDNTTFTNALGVEYHPSGWNLFARANCISHYWYGGEVTTAPANAVATHWDINYTWAGDPPRIKAECDDQAPYDYIFYFWISVALPRSRNYNRGPFTNSCFRYWWDISDPGDITLPGDYLEGARVCIMDRGQQADGAITARYYQLLDCVT